MDFVTLQKAMCQAALMAGSKIMEVYQKASFNIALKENQSPVTEADRIADTLISKTISAAFPRIPLITEEQADSHALKAKTFLIVDPLDGTKEFINRRDDFTVNIAYVEKGVPLRGIVYAPAYRRLFYTDARGHAFEKKVLDISENTYQTQEAKRLFVDKANNAALRVTVSKSHLDKGTKDYIFGYHCDRLISAGSSLKFCLLASGEADLYPRLSRTMEWDTAAGDAVLRAAGGMVVRYDDYQPLQYGKSGWENPFFIAKIPGVNLVAQ